MDSKGDIAMNPSPLSWMGIELIKDLRKCRKINAELLKALEAINNHWESGNFSRQPHLWEPMRKAIANATKEK